MIRLKHAVFGIGLAIISGTVSIPSYAYYTGGTKTAQNSMDISHVSLLHFENNGGAGEMPDISIPFGHGHIVPENELTKTGYTFTEWNTKADGSGASLPDGGNVDALQEKLPDDVTDSYLYAQWRPNTYTVSFHANGGGGTAMTSVPCTYDRQALAPANTYQYKDHLFLGWNTKADGSGTMIPAGGAIMNLTAEDQGKVTLYAAWEDESAGLIETNWNKTASQDKNGNGKADRLELKPGSTYGKDPSLKNHTSKAVYGYILVSVPSTGAKMNGDASYKVYDAVTLNVTEHWKLVKSAASANVSGRSKYLYRYDTPLKAYGTAELSPYHDLRHADRSTDLMTGFTVRNFIACPALSSTVDACGIFIEAAAPVAEADEMALETLVSAGLW